MHTLKVGGRSVPDMHRPPLRPEIPFQGPFGPDTGSTTDPSAEIEERGDPTLRKAPDNPGPGITGDFVPDLEERKIERPGLKEDPLLPQPKPPKKKDLPRLH